MIACHIQEYFVLENIQVYWSSSRKWTQVSDLSMINVRDFFFCIFCAFFLQTLWTSVPLCLQYYGIDFCTFPQVLVLLLQCEKKHGGQISFLPSKLPACPLPSPCPTPIFLSKNSVFPTYFFPVWVTFQMTNENHLLCKQFLFHPNSATYQCLCIW